MNDLEGDDMFRRSDRISACNRQTERRTRPWQIPS